VGKEKVDSVCFSITGEAFTRITRDLVLEGRWFFAFKMVREDLHGITWEQAMSVLAGTNKLEGASNTGGLELVKDDPKDPETERYLADMMYQYGATFVPPGAEYAYEPYGIVTGQGYSDLGGPKEWRDRGIECLRPDSRTDGFRTWQERVGIKWTGDTVYKRAMYYADDPMHDRAYVLDYPDPDLDGVRRPFAILFRPCYRNIPFWLTPCKTPQEAVDHCALYGINLKVFEPRTERSYLEDVPIDEDDLGTLSQIERTDDEAVGCGMTWSEGQKHAPRPERDTQSFLEGLVPEHLQHMAKEISANIGGTQDWTSPPERSTHDQFESGYILRDGQFYGCEYMAHPALAMRILKHKFNMDECEDSQKEGDRRGWVRCQKSALEPVIAVMCEKKPTKKQINAVFDHSQKWGPLENYEQFMEQGGMCRIQKLSG
jgi:hypothetical protein